MKKTPKIALLLSQGNSLDRALARGVARYSRINGPWMFNTYFDVHSKLIQRHVPIKIDPQDVDGVIARIPDLKTYQELIPAGFPAVIIGMEKEFLDYPWNKVTYRYDLIGQMAAEDLLRRGFKNFAYMGALQEPEWSRLNYESFSRTIGNHGIKTYKFSYPKSNARSWREYNLDQARPHAVSWLMSLPKPIGIMCCMDLQGRFIIECCNQAGINVPEQAAIIGVDNDDLVCDLCYPPLSSVKLTSERAGYEAAKLLDNMLQGKKIANHIIHIFPLGIETRRSSDVFAVEDRMVADALHYIHQHADMPMRVTDIAEALCTSVRNLEMRFNKILKRSVKQEIRCVRINKIVNLLVNTNMSLKEIALALGLDSEKNISRFFKKEKGMSPTEYRRRFA
jgi:LacI family transcriptional regulator